MPADMTACQHGTAKLCSWGQTPTNCYTVDCVSCNVNEHTQNIDVSKTRSLSIASASTVGVAFVMRCRVMRGRFRRGAVRSVVSVSVFPRLMIIVRVGMSAVSMSWDV